MHANAASLPECQSSSFCLQANSKDQPRFKKNIPQDNSDRKCKKYYWLAKSYFWKEIKFRFIFTRKQSQFCLPKYTRKLYNCTSYSLYLKITSYFWRENCYWPKNQMLPWLKKKQNRVTLYRISGKSYLLSGHFCPNFRYFPVVIIENPTDFPRRLVFSGYALPASHTFHSGRNVAKKSSRKWSKYQCAQILHSKFQFFGGHLKRIGKFITRMKSHNYLLNKQRQNS